MRGGAEKSDVGTKAETQQFDAVGRAEAATMEWQGAGSEGAVSNGEDLGSEGLGLPEWSAADVGRAKDLLGETISW